MTTACRSRIIPALTLALGVGLFSGNLSVADPPSPAQGDAGRDTRKKPIRQQRFKSLDDAVARAEEELQTDYDFPITALVYTFSTSDNHTVQARTELHFIGNSRGGYLPGRASASEAVLILVRISRFSQPVELHIVVPGFEKYVRRTILRAGELTIWDDIVLEPITARSAGALAGRVWLEDEDEALEGMVIYVDGEAVAFTDATGDFVADMVRPGKLHVSSHKTGYVGLHTGVKVARGYEQTCELVGYRRRFAHVRWAYQPDGTRSFDGEIRIGTAVLSSGKLSRVSFARGFKHVGKHSDFLITQVKDRLVLRHFDVRSGKLPGSMRIQDTSLDELYEAPESGYEHSEFALRPGDLYVFRCYDGKHYAMMEVLDVTVEPKSPE